MSVMYSSGKVDKAIICPQSYSTTFIFSFNEGMFSFGQFELPEGYEFNDIPLDIPTLIVSAIKDANCPKENLPSSNGKIKVVEYDCGHIMALSTFPDEYITDIHTFIQGVR